ncbi:TPA: hypothetical protein ACG0X0_000704 [Yersinia enterocolitica]
MVIGADGGLNKKGHQIGSLKGWYVELRVLASHVSSCNFSEFHIRLDTVSQRLD